MIAQQLILFAAKEETCYVTEYKEEKRSTPNRNDSYKLAIQRLARRCLDLIEPLTSPHPRIQTVRLYLQTQLEAVYQNLLDVEKERLAASPLPKTETALGNHFKHCLQVRLRTSDIGAGGVASGYLVRGSITKSDKIKAVLGKIASAIPILREVGIFYDLISSDAKDIVSISLNHAVKAINGIQSALDIFPRKRALKMS